MKNWCLKPRNVKIRMINNDKSTQYYIKITASV